MLSVDVNQIVPTPSDLRIGVVIRYGEGGPVRFAQVRIGDEHLDWNTMNLLLEYVTLRINRHLDAERDCGNEDEPLFRV